MAFGVRYQLDGETFWLAQDNTLIKMALGDNSFPPNAASFDTAEAAAAAAAGDSVLQVTELPAIPEPAPAPVPTSPAPSPVDSGAPVMDSGTMTPTPTPVVTLETLDLRVTAIERAMGLRP